MRALLTSRKIRLASRPPETTNTEKPCQTSKMTFSARIVIGFHPLTIFAQKLHLTRLTGF